MSVYFTSRRRPAPIVTRPDPDAVFRQGVAEEMDRARGPRQCVVCFVRLDEEQRASGHCTAHQPIDARADHRTLMDVVARLAAAEARLAAAEARLARLDEQNAAILNMKANRR